MLRGICETGAKLQHNLLKLPTTFVAKRNRYDNLKKYEFNENLEQKRVWRRKPTWLPTAKTKLFKIPPIPKSDPSEYEELKLLINSYRTYVKSIRKYYQKKSEESQVLADPEVLKKAQDEDFERCFALNEEWNKAIAPIREAEMNKVFEMQLVEARADMEKKKAELEVEKEKAEEYLRQLKKDAAKFITRENIDKAIDDCLENIVSYNAAIDLEGNWHTEIMERPLPKRRRAAATAS